MRDTAVYKSTIEDGESASICSQKAMEALFSES